MARYYQPQVVVETGVAVGYSSQTFLSALEKNGSGKLFSSDFPYFRLKDPQQYIGVLVEQRLRGNWQLYTQGDELNLGAILPQVKQIDLFHYDSDKRYKGREAALAIVRPKLSSNAVLIMDDIQDNAFFYDWVYSSPEYAGKWRVFSQGSKFIGSTGI